MEFNLFELLIFFLLFFSFSIFGIFLLKKNILIILLSIELMLLSVNFNFVIFSFYLDDLLGQVFPLFVLSVAAAESAIGLAILVVYYRIKGIVSINFISSIKG